MVHNLTTSKMNINQFLNELCMKTCSKKDNRLVHIFLTMVKTTIWTFTVYSQDEKETVSNMILARISKVDFDDATVKDTLVEVVTSKLKKMPVSKFISIKDKI